MNIDQVELGNRKLLKSSILLLVFFYLFVLSDRCVKIPKYN